MSRYNITYTSVAERREKIKKKRAKLQKKCKFTQPVIIQGKSIANTFWGRAWCDNLEVYSDWENRLPRGRSYVRNGSVLDLQLEPGKITGLVMGSNLYNIDITVKPLEFTHWQNIQRECAGQIDSLVELLQGKLSKGIMEIITRPGNGLFPKQQEIQMRCSCPDYASLCKHLAAALYSIGARLDQQPELLFLLRQVDHRELITRAMVSNLEINTTAETKLLDESELSNLFGIDLGDISPPPSPPEVVNTMETKPSPVTKSVFKPTTAKKSTNRETHNRLKETFTPIQITSRELNARGIPVHIVQSWLQSEVLKRTEKRGAYLTTIQTDQRIQDYLNRKKV